MFSEILSRKPKIFISSVYIFHPKVCISLLIKKQIMWISVYLAFYSTSLSFIPNISPRIFSSFVNNLAIFLTP